MSPVLGVNFTPFLRFTGNAGEALASETSVCPLPARPPPLKRIRRLLRREPARLGAYGASPPVGGRCGFSFVPVGWGDVFSFVCLISPRRFLEIGSNHLVLPQTPR